MFHCMNIAQCGNSFGNSIHEHLGSFQFLAIVNEVAVNIFIQYFLWVFICISLGKRSGIAGSESRCILTSRKITRLFSKATVPFFILSSIVWAFQWLHILTNACCEVLFHCLRLLPIVTSFSSWKSSLYIMKYVFKIFSPDLSIHFSYHLLTRVFVCSNFYKI